MGSSPSQAILIVYRPTLGRPGVVWGDVRFKSALHDQGGVAQLVEHLVCIQGYLLRVQVPSPPYRDVVQLGRARALGA